MSRTFSLSYLTCGTSPLHALKIAAQTGYQMVGVRLAPAVPGGAAYPIWQNPAELREVKAAIADSGIGVFDIEMIRIGPDFDPAVYLPMFDCAAEIGARAVLVAGDDDNETRLTDHFIALCQTAKPFGLSMELEYMPQSRLRDLQMALRVLAKAGQENQAVIIDALHHSRAGTPLCELAQVPREWISYWQICDGPPEIPTTIEGLNFAARHARLLPGDGSIDLVTMAKLLPKDVPISVETPNDAQSSGLTPQDWAARALVATKRVFDNL